MGLLAANGTPPAAGLGADDWHPGEEQDDRAVRHREGALKALADGCSADALTHALLAVESRIEELTVYVARLG